MINSSILYVFGNRFVGPNSNGDYQVDCPFCLARGLTEDDGKHLYLNPGKNKAHCFRCDYRSSFAETIRKLKGDAPVDFDETEEDKKDKEIEQANVLPQEFVLLDEETAKLVVLAPYLEYLYSRKMTLDRIKKYGIGVCVSGRFRGRLVIPAWNYGKLEYFVARTIWGNKPKYKNPHAPKKDALFNFECALSTGMIVLVEGVFSAIAAGDSGVALFGKNPYRLQVERIVKEARKIKVVVMLDGDAINESKKLALELYRSGVEKLYIGLFNDGDDPAEYRVPPLLVRYVPNSPEVLAAFYKFHVPKRI